MATSPNSSHEIRWRQTPVPDHLDQSSKITSPRFDLRASSNSRPASSSNSRPQFERRDRAPSTSKSLKALLYSPKLGYEQRRRRTVTASQVQVTDPGTPHYFLMTHAPEPALLANQMSHPALPKRSNLKARQVQMPKTQLMQANVHFNSCQDQGPSQNPERHPLRAYLDRMGSCQFSPIQFRRQFSEQAHPESSKDMPGGYKKAKPGKLKMNIEKNGASQNATGQCQIEPRSAPVRTGRRSAKDFFYQGLIGKRLARRNSTNCDLYSVDAALALGNGDEPKCATNRHSSNSSLFTLNSPVMPLVQKNGAVDQKANDFLTLLERMQSQRLDDQRCEMPELVGNFTILAYFSARNLA
ncbi:goLoco motif domain-containing protein [Ditylenchus destructor]|uniref:GoLoco motif domain-containing protein n=1 Tax=Ditylenchus destructor TaxID=166010 RepID=A0AAD4N074_9BILA|nr:goLoco motif domain-containing protein [Ditylenchus destructor]